MKVINDAGEVLGEYTDDATVVVFTEQGAQFVLPKVPDDAEAPEHLLIATATVGFAASDEGYPVVMEWFKKHVEEGGE